jgi:hypothetical protein
VDPDPFSGLEAHQVGVEIFARLQGSQYPQRPRSAEASPARFAVWFASLSAGISVHHRVRW